MLGLTLERDLRWSERASSELRSLCTHAEIDDPKLISAITERSAYGRKGLLSASKQKEDAIWISSFRDYRIMCGSKCPCFYFLARDMKPHAYEAKPTHSLAAKPETSS